MTLDFSALFDTISVCHVADCLGPTWPVEIGIRPLCPRFKVAGPAFTVLCAPDDNLTLHHALHVAPAGHVIVGGVSGPCDAALWGELMSISAQSRGLKGTVLDGPARDPLEIEALGYPVFSRRITPRQAAKRAYGAIGAPVRCGAVTVNPGDIVLADANGLLAVPADRIEEVLEAARQGVVREKALQGQLRAGRTFFELLELDAFVPDGRKGREPHR